MKYIAALILTIISSPMLLLWLLIDTATGNSNTADLLSDWWL